MKITWLVVLPATPLMSLLSDCIVVFHSIYGFWLFLCFLLVIVLFVFCTTTSVRKKARENDGDVTDVTSGHMTNVTSGHLTDVTSGDVTSGSTPFPNYDGLQILKTVEVLIKPLTCGCRNTHRVMMKNPIIFWKPIIRFVLFWEPIYCNVFYVI